LRNGRLRWDSDRQFAGVAAKMAIGGLHGGPAAFDKLDCGITTIAHEKQFRAAPH
jgi:hypothetical protein